MLIGPKRAVGQERQDGECDNREPGDRLDIALIESIEKAVKFASERENRDGDRGGGDGDALVPRPRQKAKPDGQ